MKIYLCGPMTGLPEHNFPAFQKAAVKLRKQGHHVLSPAENDGGSKDKHWSFYMRLDVSSLAQVDKIVVLPGWENSRGAQIELILAEALQIPVYDWHEEYGFDLDAGPIQFRTVARASQGIESPSEEAYRLVRGARRESYGHPADDYTRTAKLWSAILGHEVTMQQAILCMIAVKISRQCHAHKRDNIVDICGYAECLDLVEEAVHNEENISILSHLDSE